MNVLDCLKAILPKDTEIVMEVDHSAGRANSSEDSLHVPNMNLK